MFLGEHQHTLDAKGRVILPAPFRERLSNGVVLAPSQDHCIDVYPAATFERRVERLRQLPREQGRVRQYKRVLLAGAHSDRLDSQGRVTVPARLRDYAGLDRELTIVGQDALVEVWDRDNWDSYLDGAEVDFAGLDQPFADLQPVS